LARAARVFSYAWLGLLLWLCCGLLHIVNLAAVVTLPCPTTFFAVTKTTRHRLLLWQGWLCQGFFDGGDGFFLPFTTSVS
jgi:hypothetical protein